MAYGDVVAHLVAHQTSMAEPQKFRVRIRNLSQWSWGAAGSLCNTVKSQGRGGKPPPEAKKIYLKNIYSPKNTLEIVVCDLEVGGEVPLGPELGGAVEAEVDVSVLLAGVQG